MKRTMKRFACVLAITLLCQWSYSAFAGVYCANGAGVGATACVTVATGCSASTPQGTKCDTSGRTNWCECDKNWSGSVWYCGCDWIY